MPDLSKNVTDKMSSVCEASMLLREIARPGGTPGESAKAAMRRLTTRLPGWKQSRVKDLWYQHPRLRVRPEELDALRRYCSDRSRVQREQDKAASNEIRELHERVARLERLLEATDPAFHGPSIAAVRQMGRDILRGRGLLDRPKPSPAE